MLDGIELREVAGAAEATVLVSLQLSPQERREEVRREEVR